MLRFINVRELHTQTPKAMLMVEKGEKLIVTKRGKPKAILLRINEDEIEDLVLSSPPLGKTVRAAEKDALKRGWRSLRDVRKELGLDV
jgi:antitoxin (DNA-binding transcriptional repressor) of toxin-antitoxin stability system